MHDTTDPENGLNHKQLDVFSLLNVERQNAILDEVLNERALAAFDLEDSSGDTNLADVVRRLTEDPLWSKLQDIKLSDVLNALMPKNTPRAKPQTPTKPHTPVVKASPENGVAPTGKKRGRKPKIDVGEEILSVLTKFIAENPGLRSEEIQKNFAGDEAEVKAALVRLRNSGAVKTEGQKRATTYATA